MPAHSCFDNSLIVAIDGYDVLVERCGNCGRIRYEQDGVRPMAWFLDRSNPTGLRYSYSGPHNGPAYPDHADRGPWVFIEAIALARAYHLAASALSASQAIKVG